MDAVAENEPLMAAIGRIALRSAELAEMFDVITAKLDKKAGLKSKGLMLGRKIELGQTVVIEKMPDYPELAAEFA